MSASPEYLLRWRGRQSGPHTLAEINRLLDEHEIGMGHEVQYQNGWVTVEEFLESVNPAAKGPAPIARQPSAQPTANPVAADDAPSIGRPKDVTAMAKGSVGDNMTIRGAGSPPPPQAAQAQAPAAAALAAARPRYRLVYALLAILLGFTGLHNFYARHWITGAVQFLVSCASYLLGFGVIAPWLWALVEAVVVRKDGYEMEMS